MDLFAKVIALIVIVVVIAAIFVTLSTKLGGSGQQQNATSAQNLVLSYIKSAYPTAQVYPINVSRSNLTNDSWDIFLGVVYNHSSACPTIEIEDFDYPAVNILPRTDNVYSTNCKMSNGEINLGQVKLPAAANVDSYTESAGAQDYVGVFGYPNVTVTAAFSGNTAGTNMELDVGQLTNVWVVNYTAQRANYTEFVVLNRSGSFIGNYPVPKAG